VRARHPGGDIQRSIKRACVVGVGSIGLVTPVDKGIVFFVGKDDGTVSSKTFSTQLERLPRDEQACIQQRQGQAMIGDGGRHRCWVTTTACTVLRCRGPMLKLEAGGNPRKAQCRDQ